MPWKINVYYLIVLLFFLGFDAFSQRSFDLQEKAFQLYQQGKIKDAINISEIGLQICKEEYGEEHPNYASALNNLAFLYLAIGNYFKVEPLQIQALAIRKKVLGEDHPDYANSLNSQAVLYQDMGNYTKAEPLYLQALAIYKKVHMEEHADFARSLNNLAGLYCDMGNYVKAEPLCLQALTIRKKVLGEWHPDYAKSVNNLASFYCSIYNYTKAEPLFLQAIAIQKKVLGEGNLDYAATINNLALLYRYIGNYARAETLFLKSLAIKKNVLGKDHPDYAYSLNSLALLYYCMGNYANAEPLYLQALAIYKKVHMDEHPDYASSINSLAFIYASMGKYDQSEPLFMQALAIYKKVLGKEHPECAVSLYNLAGIKELTEKYLIANNLYMQALIVEKKNWQKNLSFFSGAESSVFLEKNLCNLNGVFSFLSRNIYASIGAELIDFNLLIKNVMLSNNQYLSLYASQSKDSSVVLQWTQYKTLQLQISKQLQLPLAEQKNLVEMKEQTEVLEKELMRKLPAFQQAVLNNNITWKDVQNKLKSTEAAIDFVSFRYYDKRWTDTTLYAAFVIRPGWKEPRFVNLFREEQLISLFNSTNTSSSINALYADSSSLYQLIWQPMDSLLTGVKKVYLSPSGLLHRVSFSAIATPEGGRLIDRYAVETVSNIRILAEQRTVVTEHPTSFVLMGGIDYDQAPSVTVPYKPDYVTTDTAFSSLRALRGGKWSFLPGTANEINGIQKIANSISLPVTVYTKNNASEENFKTLGGGNNPTPSVLHIATHGFSFATPQQVPRDNARMFQEDKRTVYRQSEDPLTRAGLVMAGGNKVWSTGLPYSNHEDGILTAREVSDMNLRGCILATLSACETGLGEIKGSEGVFGLQRAFKMAGVQYLILSLWKVPDDETAAFMQLFYTNWLTQKLPIREAFRQAQTTMCKKYKPYQWAAFVLLE